MLAAAGVPHEVARAGIDEAAAKAELAGLCPRALAEALAERKAMEASRRFPGALVLGCDQVAELDGEILDKPETREEAAGQLRKLRGATHRQHSAAVIYIDCVTAWRHTDSARLQVRNFSYAFLEAYLDSEWPEIGGCAGGYRLEGPGAQLFTSIEGSHFSIIGLPLLPLLDYLRERGVIET